MMKLIAIKTSILALVLFGLGTPLVLWSSYQANYSSCSPDSKLC